jgi:hypothetical protein
MALVFPAWQALNLLNRGVLKGRRLYPTRLKDWTYAVNEAALTDRAFAPQRNILKTGVVTPDSSLVMPTDSFDPSVFWIKFNNQTCYVQTAPKDYAITMPSQSMFRFEVRGGDSPWSGDKTGNRRRSECISADILYNAGQTVWTSFSFVVTIKGAASFDTMFANFIPINRTTVFQWHAPVTVSGGPFMNCELNQGKLEFVTRSPVTGPAEVVTHYSQPRPTDGVVHHVVMRATLGAAGKFTVWLDGTQIVDTNTPIGFYDVPGPIGYPQWGIYQPNFDVPAVIYHANVEWGTTDLSSRITNPLPVTVPPGGWV